MFSVLSDQFWSTNEPTKAYSDLLPANDTQKNSPAPMPVHPNPSTYEKPETIKKVRNIANPILKTLGLVLLFGIIGVLRAYSLVDPVITSEMTRLIFLCVIAFILQKPSDTAPRYRNRIVGAVIYD